MKAMIDGNTQIRAIAVHVKHLVPSLNQQQQAVQNVYGFVPNLFAQFHSFGGQVDHFPGVMQPPAAHCSDISSEKRAPFNAAGTTPQSQTKAKYNLNVPAFDKQNFKADFSSSNLKINSQILDPGLNGPNSASGHPQANL